ncbi:hypothetical protein [Rickettsia endosymbiont of Orchestes rusci]
MDNNCANQRLYWSLGTPLKYMGLSLDEWYDVAIVFRTVSMRQY